MTKTTVAALAAMTALTSPALAMTFTEVQLADGSGTAIKLSGDIERGDGKRFYDFVMAIKDPKHMQVIKLDSVGGYISESLEMAETIKLMKRPTAVPDNAVCASACFFLWASGTERYAASTAKIGVHRASGTPQADTSSIKMAEIYKSMRIPDSVIVKMITTASSDMTWLTQADYNAMSVTVITPEPQVVSTPAKISTPYEQAYAECNKLWPRAVGNMQTRAKCLAEADEKYWLPTLGKNADLGRKVIDYRYELGVKIDHGEIALQEGLDRFKAFYDLYKHTWEQRADKPAAAPSTLPCTYALPGQFCTPDRR